jgi:hypothetical protein
MGAHLTTLFSILGTYETASRILSPRNKLVGIVPHGKDVNGRTVADLFVDDKNLVEMLSKERR